MMRLCFLSPPQRYKNKRTSSFTSLNEYLGIAYAVSLLRHHGLQADILYFDTESINCTAICQEIENKGYTMIGFPSYYYSQIQLARIMNTVHRKNPDAFFFVGGFLSSLSIEYFRKLKHLQCVIVGESEQTLLELALVLKNGGDWKAVAGLMYVKNGVPYRTAKRDLIPNLDSLPFPYREAGDFDTFPMITSRGCYGRCNYCGLNEFYRLSNGCLYRRRSPENVIDEIVELRSSHAVKHIQFSDGNFHIASQSGRNWFNRFTINKNKRLQVSYSCYMRANEIVAAPDLISLFCEIGLNRLFIGIESLVQSDLDFYHKDITVEENIKALDIVERLSIDYDLGIMLFNPTTTPDTLLEFVQVLRRIKFYQTARHVIKPISVNSTAIASIGTPLYAYVQQHHLQADNIRGYRFIDPRTEIIYTFISAWSETIRPLIHQCFDLADRSANSVAVKAAQELFFLDLSFIENTIYRIWSPESMHMGTAAIPPDFRDRLSGIQNMLNVEN